ncbi:MAG TPA: hypothetical protein VFM70_10650 [Salinimicrobium sp.]|nr:hypothetical protein [Salinimicrobium sp.]
MKAHKTMILLYPYFFALLGFFVMRGGMPIVGNMMFVVSVLYAMINLGLVRDIEKEKEAE